MNDAQHLDHGQGITQLDAEYVRPGVAAIYLLEQQGKLAVIETGTSHSIPALIKLIEDKGYSADDVDYVLPTHVHLDHAGGAGTLMAQCPNATLVVHPRGARHLIDPSKLIDGTKAIYGEDFFKQIYGDIKPVPAERVIEAPDNFSVDFNGRTLQFLDTPGHARHHYSVWDETSRSIFAGDSFGLAYPKLFVDDQPFALVTTSPVQFDPEAMSDSIDRQVALNPERIFLTHFGPIRPTKQVVQQLKASLACFVSLAMQQPPDAFDEEAVSRRMSDYILRELKSHGTTLSEEFLTDWLSSDIRLNTQGLGVWRQRHD